MLEPLKTNPPRGVELRHRLPVRPANRARRSWSRSSSTRSNNGLPAAQHARKTPHSLAIALVGKPAPRAQPPRRFTPPRTHEVLGWLWMSSMVSFATRAHEPGTPMKAAAHATLRARPSRVIRPAAAPAGCRPAVEHVPVPIATSSPRRRIAPRGPTAPPPANWRPAGQPPRAHLSVEARCVQLPARGRSRCRTPRSAASSRAPRR